MGKWARSGGEAVVVVLVGWGLEARGIRGRGRAGGSVDVFSKSSKVQGSEEGRKCSSIAFSPSVWKRPRLRMRSLAKSHVLSFD